MLDAKVRQTDDARELSQLHTFLAHLNGKRPVRDIVHYVRYRCGGRCMVAGSWVLNQGNYIYVYRKH